MERERDELRNRIGVRKAHSLDRVGDRLLEVAWLLLDFDLERTVLLIKRREPGRGKDDEGERGRGGKRKTGKAMKKEGRRDTEEIPSAFWQQLWQEDLPPSA
jgi:hypothetical protein